MLGFRPFSSSEHTGYRFGFNGMEKDDEVAGNGNTLNAEFRQYDPRIGRWKSLDPLMAKYPHQSPYAAFNNNPIYFADPTGLEGDPPVRENTLGAPELAVANVSGNSTPIDEDVAAKGFERDKDDPLFGFVNNGKGGYNKVFFDPGFDDRGTKGAYFQNEPKKQPVGTLLNVEDGIAFGFDITTNEYGDVDAASLQRIETKVQESFSSFTSSAPPVGNQNELVRITIHHAAKSPAPIVGGVKNPAQEAKFAQQVFKHLSSQYGGSVFITNDPAVKVGGTSGAVNYTMDGTINVTISTRVNEYGF